VLTGSSNHGKYLAKFLCGKIWEVVNSTLSTSSCCFCDIRQSNGPIHLIPMAGHNFIVFKKLYLTVLLPVEPNIKLVLVSKEESALVFHCFSLLIRNFQLIFLFFKKLFV
jgi:hypothetical protein